MNMETNESGKIGGQFFIRERTNLILKFSNYYLYATFHSGNHVHFNQEAVTGNDDPFIEDNSITITKSQPGHCLVHLGFLQVFIISLIKSVFFVTYIALHFR